MNPAALKANLRDLTPGSTLLINVDTFEHAQPRQGGLRGEPAHATARSRTYRVYEIPMTSITVEATKPLGVKPRDAERSKNFFALGLICWMYTRPTEPLARLDQERGSRAGRRCSRPTSPRSRAGVQLRRDRRAVRPPLRGEARAAAGRHLPQHHRQRRAVVRARRGRAEGEAAAVLRVVPDHARVRHPARAVEAQALRREDAAGRRRDRGGRRRGRRRVRRQPRGHRHERTRCRPQVGGDRPRDQPRAADAARRRAARRPVDRTADQDRAGRPHARDVRPARRGAAADRRRASRRPTASTPRSRRCASR